MVIGVMISFFSPAVSSCSGSLPGIVMIAQMAFLSRVREHQGTAMGLFTTMSYLGMALLPFYCRDCCGFGWVFCGVLRDGVGGGDGGGGGERVGSRDHGSDTLSSGQFSVGDPLSETRAQALGRQ